MKFELKRDGDSITIDLRVLVVALFVATILTAGKPDLVDVAVKYVAKQAKQTPFIRLP